jgi:hypothetical protein
MTHPETRDHPSYAGAQSDRPSSRQDRANNLVPPPERAGWWKGWNPLWGWALLGAIVAMTMVFGILFGGDGDYS